jgi:acetyl esterase
VPTRPETSDGVVRLPPELLQFQLTLTPPEAVTARELLTSVDGYINQSRHPACEVIRQVPVREVAGWRVTADVHRPPGGPPFPTLVYLHGGGWVMGAPSSHHRLAQDLAAMGLLTIMIDYRRAPKHRFPAAVEDTVHALHWARANAATYGGEPSRLVVGGDSAGANLAAAALACGEADPVAAALLLYGIYDVHRALPRLTAMVGGPDPESQLYLRPEDHRGMLDDPRLHPERYCTGFPPSLVLVGERDPLLPESAALADRLAESSVPHELVVVRGAPHGFLQMPTEQAHEDGLRAVEGFLSRHGLTPGGPQAR